MLKNGETLNVKFKIDYKETPSGFNKEFKLGEGKHYFADSEEEIVKVIIHQLMMLK